jgi:hypothetical protein
MKTPVKIFHWLPGVICILAILFVSVFALDAFAPGFTVWQQLGGFSIHLIPSFMLIGFLIVAWKWEFIGGIIFMVIGLGLTPLVFIMNYQRNHPAIGGISLIIILTITIPFVIVGILFMISQHLKKKEFPKISPITSEV